MTASDQTPTIAELNDRFRKGDRAWASKAAKSLATWTQIRTLALTSTGQYQFDDFNEGNDPYQEHDFGSVEYDGDKWLWKIDYYDPVMNTVHEDQLIRQSLQTDDNHVQFGAIDR